MARAARRSIRWSSRTAAPTALTSPISARARRIPIRPRRSSSPKTRAAAPMVRPVPNPANDPTPTPQSPIARTGAIGYAESAESVLATHGAFTALFDGKVGADHNAAGGGAWAFAITDANGNGFNGASSGLTTDAGL